MNLSDIFTKTTHPTLSTNDRKTLTERIFAGTYGVVDADDFADIQPSQLVDRVMLANGGGRVTFWGGFGNIKPTMRELCGEELWERAILADYRGGVPMQNHTSVLAVQGAVLAISILQGYFRLYLIESVHENEKIDAAVTGLVETFGLHRQRPVANASCYTLIQQDGNYNLISIGVIAEEPIWDNYTADVSRRFQAGCRRLEAKAGGMLLLSGPPGTGKTHLVRAAIHTLDPNRVAVVIPSMTNLDVSSPALITALLRLGRPVMLALEDADNLLATRDGPKGSASGVSGLLNFADGILGQLLNISIIATTNLPAYEIDPALLRPGRLVDRIEIDRLRDPDLVRVGRRLGVPPSFWEKEPKFLEKEPNIKEISASLAELYAAASKETVT